MIEEGLVLMGVGIGVVMLFLTLMAGPIGLLVYLAARTGLSRAHRPA